MRAEKYFFIVAMIVCFALAIGCPYFFCGEFNCENKGFGTLFGRIGLYGFSIYGLVFAIALWKRG